MLMNETQLTHFLQQNIPLAAAMEVRVRDIQSERVEIFAPFAPNKNHHGTGFGGSVTTLAILAAWALIRTRYGEMAAEAHLVIQRQELVFLKPIVGDFCAISSLAADADWAGFETMYEKKGRARTRVGAVVECNGEVCATFEGEFVVMAKV